MPQPVSYTHLDVYKRQIPNSAKHKEEAADFLLFLQEEDNIKYLYESANAMMPNNNFDESWVSSEIDRKVLEWQKEDNNFCYQLYFAPMFETDGLIPTVQKMFSEGLAPVSYTHLRRIFTGVDRDFFGTAKYGQRE